MKTKVIAGVLVALVAWWAIHTGLQNRAENRSRELLREIVAGAQDQSAGALQAAGLQSVFADVDVSAEPPATVVYRYTYRALLERGDTAAEEIPVICGEVGARATASTILDSMRAVGITGASVRVDYVHPEGRLDFSCTYP